MHVDSGQLPARPRRVPLHDADEALRIGIRQLREQDGVGDAEHRGTGADAECENKNRVGGEDRIATQRAQRESDVCDGILQRTDPARVTYAFLVFVGAAKRDQRVASRLLVARASAHALFDLAIQVEPELVVHLAVLARRKEQRACALEHVGEDGHVASASFALMIASTAPVIRRQDAAFSLSCLCPAFVMT